MKLFGITWYLLFGVILLLGNRWCLHWEIYRITPWQYNITLPQATSSVNGGHLGRNLRVLRSHSICIVIIEVRRLGTESQWVLRLLHGDLWKFLPCQPLWSDGSLLLTLRCELSVCVDSACGSRWSAQLSFSMIGDIISHLGCSHNRLCLQQGAIFLRHLTLYHQILVPLDDSLPCIKLTLWWLIHLTLLLVWFLHFT
jgi:hypothetical protein